jgi:hypothetical protein
LVLPLLSIFHCFVSLHLPTGSTIAFLRSFGSTIIAFFPSSYCFTIAFHLPTGSIMVQPLCPTMVPPS